MIIQLFPFLNVVCYLAFNSSCSVLLASSPHLAIEVLLTERYEFHVRWCCFSCWDSCLNLRNHDSLQAIPVGSESQTRDN